MSTFSQLKLRVARKLGLDQTAGSDEDSMVGEHLNEGVLEVLLATHCHVALASSVTLTSGSADYELDTDVLAIHKVLAGTVPLERVDEERIYELRRSASTSTTSQVYALSGSNLFMIYPTPSTASTLTIYYVPRPTPMSSASHDPSSATYGGIPSEHHKAIEFYALWQGADYDDDASSGIGEKYMSQFQQQIAKINNADRLKGGRLLPRARVGRRPRLAHSQSEDSTWN